MNTDFCRTGQWSVVWGQYHSAASTPQQWLCRLVTWHHDCTQTRQMAVTVPCGGRIMAQPASVGHAAIFHCHIMVVPIAPWMMAAPAWRAGAITLRQHLELLVGARPLKRWSWRKSHWQADSWHSLQGRHQPTNSVAVETTRWGPREEDSNSSHIVPKNCVFTNCCGHSREPVRTMAGYLRLHNCGGAISREILLDFVNRILVWTEKT
jgi:hypothetical protein